MGRHFAPDLADKVISWSRRRGNELNSRQRVALSRYRRRTVYDLRRNSSHSDEETLRSFFNISTISTSEVTSKIVANWYLVHEVHRKNGQVATLIGTGTLMTENSSSFAP